jgi:hypothetical protein
MTDTDVYMHRLPLFHDILGLLAPVGREAACATRLTDWFYDRFISFHPMSPPTPEEDSKLPSPAAFVRGRKMEDAEGGAEQTSNLKDASRSNDTVSGDHYRCHADEEKKKNKKKNHHEVRQKLQLKNCIISHLSLLAQCCYIRRILCVYNTYASSI